MLVVIVFVISICYIIFQFINISAVLSRGSASLKKYALFKIFNYNINFENLSSGIFKILIFHFQIMFLSSTIQLDALDGITEIGKTLSKPMF